MAIVSIVVKKTFIKVVLIMKMCRFVGGGHGGFAAFFNAGVHTVSWILLLIVFFYFSHVLM